MTVPEGSLPVWSCDTEAEAKALIVMTCPRNPDGTYYARELAYEQTLENLGVFSHKLKRAAALMKANQRKKGA